MQNVQTILLLLANLVSALITTLTPGGTRSLMAENLLLRQQLLVLGRQRKRSPPLTGMDRLVFGALAACITPKRLQRVAIALRPASLIKFHKLLAEKKYQQLFSSKRRQKPGPKGPSRETIDLIISIKRHNRRFGSDEIQKCIYQSFGLHVGRDVIRRILKKHFPNDTTPDNNGPSWLTFLADQKDSLWSMDLFRCESLTLRSHWVMVVIDVFSRQLVGFAVHAGAPDGAAVCRMFREIAQGKTLPQYLSTDHDPLFKCHRWQANLRIYGIEAIKSVPYTPVSHPFVERVIGTIRRECLDRTLFWSEHDLLRKLNRYRDYYNHTRGHLSLGGKTPLQMAANSEPAIANIQNYQWQSFCNGLFKVPVCT